MKKIKKSEAHIGSYFASATAAYFLPATHMEIS